MKKIVLVAMAIFFTTVGLAAAVPLTVPNFSFEEHDPNLADGSSTPFAQVGNSGRRSPGQPGWESTGGVSVWNTASPSFHSTPLPHGTHVMDMETLDFTSIKAALFMLADLKEGFEYTVSVDISGGPLSFWGTIGEAQVQVYAIDGMTPTTFDKVITGLVLTPPVEWTTLEYSFIATAAHVGMDLLIELADSDNSPAGYVHWDNLRVDEDGCDYVWSTGNGLAGDLDQDCYIGLGDFQVLGSEWMGCTDPAGQDCVVVQDSSDYFILKDNAAVVVDGDLSDWSNPNWIALDQAYFGVASDIGNLSTDARFALRWSDVDNMVYAAVIIEDGNHFFEAFPTGHNTSDRLEIYSRGDPNDTNGTMSWGEGGTENYDEAQQYSVGATGTGSRWESFGDGAPIIDPSASEFQSAVSIVGSRITYEIGVRMFSLFADRTFDTTVEIDLEVGVEIGFDLVAGTITGDPNTSGGYGMRSENLMLGKFSDSTQFQTYQLADTLPVRECGDWGYLPSDLFKDCIVDLLDLRQWVIDWLRCNDPGEPTCEQVF
jgi:hypothetical protein